MATMLKIKLVGLTAGLVKPSTLIWKGRSKKAPDTPPIEVKNDTTKATRGGKKGLISTPEIAKCIYFLLSSSKVRSYLKKSIIVSFFGPMYGNLSFFIIIIIMARIVFGKIKSHFPILTGLLEAIN